MGLEPLFDRCPVLPVDASISIARYLRSIKQTLQQAQHSDHSGDLERAALLHIRVLQLICKTLPSHPEYGLEENKPVVAELHLIADSSLSQIEQLAPSVEEIWTAGSTKQTGKVVRRLKLNKVEISVSLIELFERVAAENTLNGLCTIGVLAGRLQSDDNASAPNSTNERNSSSSPALTVTALIIPSQTSDTISSEMRHETDLFNLLEVKGLSSLGWIHLYPGQTQLDLSASAARTQAGFQTTHAEAVAIVVVPKSNQGRYRVMTLTDPGGLNYVLACASRDCVPEETIVPHGLPGGGRPVSTPARHVVIRNDGIPSFKLYDLRSMGAERDSQLSAPGQG